MKRLTNIILVILVVLSFAACAKVETTDNTMTVCSNGKFIGKAEEEETGGLSFKGTPYAKAPAGNLRWKAPEPVDKSDEIYETYEFGNPSIQYK